MGGKVAQLATSTHPTGLIGTVLVKPPHRRYRQVLPLEAHEVQKHAYDNPENVAGAIACLTVRPLSDTLRQQIVDDSLREPKAVKYASPNESHLEDIGRLLAERIRIPTLVHAGEADRERPLAAQQA